MWTRPPPRWRLSTAPSPSNWNAPLRGFSAWRLTESDPAGRARIHALADAAVRELDSLRPAHARGTGRACAIRWRRLQHALLERGYPYVFDQFTFHITLRVKTGGR